MIGLGLLQSSSMVERAAVNRDVVGSSPTSGAIFYTVAMQRCWFGSGTSAEVVGEELGLNAKTPPEF